MQRKKMKPLTTVQMVALRQKIIEAPQGTELGKKVMLYLLEHSKQGTREVVLYLRSKLGREGARTIHDICSSRRSINLDRFSERMKINLRFDRGGGIPNHYFCALISKKSFYSGSYSVSKEMILEAKPADIQKISLCQSKTKKGGKG
ncbi:MAG: hypothetical protein PHT40_01690 [Patescibacteria group bacterium]|nr:hypothetical protein [Patescibacteria group bacterium]